MSYEKSEWQLWSDVMIAIACTISNSVDKRHFENRKNEFKNAMKRIGSEKKLNELFVTIISALEENPNQDFLGDLFMEMELGRNRLGQFFTPYKVCETMAGTRILPELASTEAARMWQISRTTSRAARHLKERSRRHERNQRTPGAYPGTN